MVVFVIVAVAVRGREGRGCAKISLVLYHSAVGNIGTLGGNSGTIWILSRTCRSVIVNSSCLRQRNVLPMPIL